MKEGRMSLARYGTRVPNSASIPMKCDICRERSVAILIVDFIFACNQCAKRISVALGNGMGKRALERQSFLDSDTRSWVR